MQRRTPTEELLDLAADVLADDRHAIRTAAKGAPFISLGGGLPEAVRLLATADDQFGMLVDLAGLLGPAPLEEVLSLAVPAPAPARRGGPGRSVREPLPEQGALLATEEFTGSGTVHQMSSAELTGPLDRSALRTALRALVARHEGLRTVFSWSPKGPVRRVPVHGEAQLVVRDEDTPAPGHDAVESVHAAMRATAGLLGGHTDRPPAVFTLTRYSDEHHVLTFVHHLAVADTWSVGLIWRELFEDYERAAAGKPVPQSPAPSPDAALERAGELAASGVVHSLTSRRIAQLADFPTTVELPGTDGRPATFDFVGDQLLFPVPPEVRERCDLVVRRAGVSRTAVLLGAWALTVGRLAGTDRVLIGTRIPRRPTSGLMRTVAPCTPTVPVRCELQGTVDYFLRGIACAFSEGIEFADVPLKSLSRGLGVTPDRSRTPLVQIGFSSQEDLLPALTGVAGLGVRLSSGHFGGASADAELTVARWGDDPLLALSYATSVLGGDDAAALAEAVSGTLRELVTQPEDAPLDRVAATEAVQYAG
ncbi:condensation domain-containing protein [Streptomyces sp. NPDC021622]|uniref:condensation domain-containing protein n=1 Tax=Streptomyces sp. NPDC021622 TaxID=3155013 RepID=UPI0033C879C9